MFRARALPRWQLRRSPHASTSYKATIRQRHADDKHIARGEQHANQDPVQVLHAKAQTLTASPPRPVSRTARILWSVFYACAFGLTGFALAWGWKTWDYLRVGHDLALPATRSKNKQLFDKSLEQSPLVQSLRRDGWTEENPSEQEHNVEDAALQLHKDATGHHLVNEHLVGKGHMATRHFRHPTEKVTVLVFMADFACESWPDTLHGGIATTVIQEALDTHVKHFPGYAPVRNRETTMNYRLPLHPAVVYSVLIQTDEVGHPDQSTGQADESFLSVGVNVLVNEMDRAPHFVETYDETTKTKQRTCKIHDARQGVSAYVRGGSVLFLASKRYQEMAQKNQQIVPALREKINAWREAYKSNAK